MPFEEIVKEKNISPCYITKQGVDVWENGLKTCIPQKEVEREIAYFLSRLKATKLKMKDDPIFGLKVVFSVSDPECGPLEDCYGMFNPNTNTVVVNIKDWRRTLRHEILHVLLPDDPGHMNYRWRWFNLMLE